MILDGITNILNLGDLRGWTEELTVKLEEVNTHSCRFYTEPFFQVGAIDEIERLQEHDNDDVYKAALNIIDTWFRDEPEERVLEFYIFHSYQINSKLNEKKTPKTIRISSISHHQKLINLSLSKFLLIFICTYELNKSTQAPKCVIYSRYRNFLIIRFFLY